MWRRHRRHHQEEVRSVGGEPSNKALNPTGAARPRVNAKVLSDNYISPSLSSNLSEAMRWVNVIDPQHQSVRRTGHMGMHRLPRPLSQQAWVLALVSSIALCGCDPAFRFGGVVTDRSGNPIRNAEARVQCATTFAHARTDQEGRFLDNRIGWCPSTCNVEVTAPGRPLWSSPVMGFCKSRPSHLQDACLLVEARVQLSEPVGTGEPPNKPLQQSGSPP
jgi:hypothetical protein